MTISPPTGRSWRLAGPTAALTLALGLTAACGSSSTGGTAATSAPGTATTTASGQSSTVSGGRNARAQNSSAANGTIAAVNGSSMQVQSTDSQTTVNVTDSTTITATGTVDTSAVTAGLCITASANPTGTTPSSGATPTTDAGSSAASAPFAASMIQLSDPENGLCSSGFAGGGAPPDSSALPSGEAPSSGAMPPDGAVPSGLPDFGGTPPSGAPQGGFAGFGDLAGGTVLSVSGDSIVISQTDPSTQAVTERTVTVDGSTTYTKRASATTTALVVGQCAVVQGSVDSKGAVTATSVAVSAPTEGSTCSAGVGPGGPGGGGPAGNAGTTKAGS